ncbi:MAG: beta-glucanase precursor [Pseudomonadota bacterium]
MKKILTLLAFSVFAVGCAQTPSTTAASTESTGVDFGNFSSETLTTAAWRAMDRGDYSTAIIYTDKCIELYEEQALVMQKEVKLKRETEDMKRKQTNQEVFDNWALNDVGTSYFIKGEALANLGREEEAVEAYKVVMNQLYFANTYDPQGWFWSPAEAASKKVTMLSQDF